MENIIDVAIIGAGLTGVGAACHLQRECPDHRYVIFEARARSGGTWDLFRYPGIRSDSDMHTLGYIFKPWENPKAIADGPSILEYIRETAHEYGVEQHIRYQKRVTGLNWRSNRQVWELTITDVATEEVMTVCARFVQLCAGYYNYARGHEPEFPGRSEFRGEFVHPQFWPQGLDYTGKRVVVIGSGATAMTLVPAMAPEVKDIVMLQRSPTWVIARPARDRLANLLRTILPAPWAYGLTRWKNTRVQHWLYRRSRRNPKKLRDMLLRRIRQGLGDSGHMADFTPSYDPWDQRLCLIPDSDLFTAVKSGKARVVTAEIESLTSRGIRLRTGEELAADIIVSATGLELQIMGGAAIGIDDAPFDFPGSWSYRGIMCSGLPNLVSVFGYINASWTLRADIVSQWVCRLLNHMQATSKAVVTPELEPDLPVMAARPWIVDFDAGYMQRDMHRFPRQGDRDPWRNCQNYLRELRDFEAMDLSEPALRYEARLASRTGSPESRQVA